MTRLAHPLEPFDLIHALLGLINHAIERSPDIVGHKALGKTDAKIGGERVGMGWDGTLVRTPA